MYDYLAKIILLGPSGTGKYVLDRLKTKKNTLASRCSYIIRPGRACCIDSSRTNGAFCRRRPSESSLRVKSSKLVPERGGNESSSRYVDVRIRLVAPAWTDDEWAALGYRGNRALSISLEIILSRRSRGRPRLRHHVTCLLPRHSTIPQ